MIKPSTSARIERKLLDKLADFAKKKRWTKSQAIEIIIAQFFNYELSDNVGQLFDWITNYTTNPKLLTGFIKNT